MTLKAKSTRAPLLHPTSQFTACHFSDNRSPERVHAATVAGRVSRCVPGDGAHGRESVPGDPDGSGSRAYVVSSLPDAVRHQALAFRRHHS